MDSSLGPLAPPPLGLVMNGYKFKNIYIYIKVIFSLVDNPLPPLLLLVCPKFFFFFFAVSLNNTSIPCPGVMCLLAPTAETTSTRILLITRTLAEQTIATQTGYIWGIAC